MANVHKSLFMAAILVVTTCAVRSARANEPPADLCSLLPVSQVNSTLGTPYDSLQEGIAPRFSAGTPQGTDCTYQSKHAAANKLLFRGYVDPSADDTSWLFRRLRTFYKTTTPVSGLGDEAYFDDSNGLHVRKGKVRMLFNLVSAGGFNADREKQMKDLAAEVLSQL